VKIEDGKLHPTIHPDDAGYFSTLNQKYWMDKVTEYAQDYDVFSHPQNREDVYLVTDETPEPVVGVVGKAYTWEEVLQRGKEQYKRNTQSVLWGVIILLQTQTHYD
jgi:hypothetical protein